MWLTTGCHCDFYSANLAAAMHVVKADTGEPRRLSKVCRGMMIHCHVTPIRLPTQGDF